MSTRLTVLLGLIVLISIGFLMACGSHYSSSSDGLVLVPSRGSGVLQSFSFDLSSGHSSQINTAPVILGKPTAIAIDTAGAFAYVAVLPDSTVTNTVTATSIVSYQIKSDGTLAAGTTVSMNTLEGSDAIDPAAFAMDSSGKFLFVADEATTDSEGSPVAGSVSVFAISSGTATEAPGSPFPLPQVQGGAVPSASALAVTPTIFPAATLTTTAACSTQPPPTNEYLYVTDSENNQVLSFAVDGGTGALGPPSGETSIPFAATDRVPSGVAIDPCNRFVYVANQDSNNVSGYAICNGSSGSCLNSDGSLVSVGAPVSAANGPTAIAVDPFGNFVYVVDTLSNGLSGFKISQVSGTLVPLTPALVGTGASPVSIAIRSDGLWLFVTNNNGASISQYTITPASGALSALTGITTDNFPWGVAVR